MLFRSVKILILLSLILLLGIQQASAVAPVITLLEQNPAILYSNSSGNFSLIYGIAHDNSGLNLSSLALKGTVFDNNSGTYYHSIRVPDNNQSDVWNGRQIARAQNRNKSDPSERLNWENNVTITEGNVYKWAGVDENSSRINVVSINSTYTKIYLNGTIQDVVTNDMCYICRRELRNATKTEFEINKFQDLVVKIYDSEVMKGNDDNYVARIWLGTNIPGNIPSTSVDIYWGNYSWDPEGVVDIEDSPYGTYMTSFDATEWTNWTYQPDANANYIMFEVGAGADPIIQTNESYLVFKSSANANSGFGIDTTDVDTTSNVSFADTKVTWTGSDDSYVQYSYTPNIFVTFLRGNQTFKSMCYVQDNLGAWNNSTMHESEIHEGKFPPTGAGCDYFNFESMQDENKDCTYRGTIGFQVFTASDPDGGTVTHNLTLRYANGTYITVINNTYTNLDGSSLNISFDTSPYYSTTELYKIGCIATDDDGKSTEKELLTNFSLSPLGTTSNILDFDKLVFWGYSDIPALYTGVSDNNIISFVGGEYIFHKKTHMSQAGDVFNHNEAMRIKSFNNSNVPYFRWTGRCEIDYATITSWNTTMSSVVTQEEAEYRSYTYSDDYYSSGNVTNSNISYLGKGKEPYTAISLQHYYNSIIDNNTFSYNELGLGLSYGNNNTISNNVFSNCTTYGLLLSHSNDNIVHNNILKDSIIAGIEISSSFGVKIYENEFYYIDYVGIHIAGGDDIEVYDNTLFSIGSEIYQQSGIIVFEVNNGTFRNNKMNGGELGYYCKEVTNSIFKDNVITDKGYGITFSSPCNNNLIHNNTISANPDEIDSSGHPMLIMTNNNTITNNTIYCRDGYGFRIWNSDDNLFVNNIITLTNDSFNHYSIENTAVNSTIRDTQNTILRVELVDAGTDVTIENTNNQVFIHSSSGNSYGYSNGNFSLFTDTQEGFVITNALYTANFTNTVQLTASTPSVNNVADFDINSGNIDLIRVYNVQDNKNYVLKEGILTLQTIKSSGSTILFDKNINSGSYTIGLSSGALSGTTVIDNVYRGFEFGSIGLIAIGGMLIIMIVLLMLLSLSGKVEIGYGAVITLTGILCASAVAFGLFLYVMGYIT